MFSLSISNNGTTSFDLETTREMIISSDYYVIQRDDMPPQEAKKEYSDYFKSVPIISKLIKKIT